jgi:hypothetical protein
MYVAIISVDFMRPDTFVLVVITWPGRKGGGISVFENGALQGSREMKNLLFLQNATYNKYRPRAMLERAQRDATNRKSGCGVEERREKRSRDLRTQCIDAKIRLCYARDKTKTE